MSRPACKYPRQPSGPSGFGESGVRRLQRSGGDFQKSHPDANTTAIQSGDFSRVIVEGIPEYVTVSQGSGSSIVRDTLNHRQPFRKSLASKDIPGTLAFCDGGLYASLDTSEFDLATLGYEYESSPGVTAIVQFDRERFRHTIKYGGYYVNGRPVSTYQVYYMYLPLTPGNFMFFKNRDEVSYWGRHPDYGRCTVSLSIARLGRIDPTTTRPLADLTLIRQQEHAPEGAALEEYPLDVADFTRPMSEFMWLTRQIVLKDYTVGIFAETFFRPGEVEPGDDYIPKFWAFATPNTAQFGDMTYSDLTYGVFSGAMQPIRVPGPPEYYTSAAGRQYQFDLSATMASMQIAAVANDAFVLSWQQRMPGGWRTRVARLTVSGGNVTASMTRQTPDQATRATLEYWQSIVHVGNGIVLAKITSGFPGVDHDVTLRMSTDGGNTWGAPFAPIGLAAPLLNQYFGDLWTHKATTDADIGRVLMVGWDESKAAYYVFSSDDHGATWSRRGKVYKPATFMRIDAMLAGDGGGNFMILVPGPRGEMDVTLEDRYKDRS